MKKCPKCQSVYSDDTLKFCLQDGAILTGEPDANKTLEMSFPSAETVISNRLPETPVSFPPHIPSPISVAPPKKSGWLFALVAVLFLILGGLTAFAFMTLTGKEKAEDRTNINVVSAPNSSNLNSANESLTSKIESAFSTKPDQQLHTPARVDAPNDGFLALRSAPNLADTTLIEKIPDKAEVKVKSCVSQIVVVSGRRGRWCIIEYKRKTGWAFDGWLVF